ncbi:MAG TPA: DUF1800 domain-containing protein [Gaiellaceae bacterium]
MSSARNIPVYRGRFGPDQAERLLWRAGFGPRPGEAKKLGRKGLNGAVHALTHPGRERLVGPRPVDDDGHPIAPTDAWGHDHLWWLDRMVRSSRPLTERMTLVWHDWFATSNAGVGSQRLMLRQNNLFRRHGLGSFAHLLLSVTKDPAMLLWLNGTENGKDAPNENYGREMMELFTLGASRGYTERDVREQARALTGWRNDWDDDKGPVNFRYDRERHDPGTKRIFGKRGRFDWQDSCRLAVHHRKHASFFVEKLWSYFIPAAPPAPTRRALEALYVRHDFAIRPVVEAILKHPLLYTGPRMVKPPVVYLAGMLRATKRGIDTDAWTWLSNQAGQQLFYPPNVAGWDDDRWLDTASFLARWNIAGRVLRPVVLETDDKAPLNADKLLASALAFWGQPKLTPPTKRGLKAFARHAIADADRKWKKEQYPPLIENALRHLIAVSPDQQTS